MIEESFQSSGRPPAESELKNALRLVDFESVSFDRSGVRLESSEQRLSLDGVAKGYIVDRAVAVLRSHGIHNALVNAGGDIMALGRTERNTPWRIAIQDPFKSGGYLRVISLSDQAVATSGSYEIFFDPEKSYHHLLNPEAGRPADLLVSATTLAPTTARADALSTAAFVSPRVLKASGTEGMTVARNGRQILTGGFKQRLERS